MLSNIFAASYGCWEAIDCTVSGQPVNGSIIHPSYDIGSPSNEEMCQIKTLSLDSAPFNYMKIKIQQGGDYGSPKTVEYLINRDNLEGIGNKPITFYFDKSTSPTYVTCISLYYDSPGNPTNGHEEMTIDYWVGAYGEGWVTYHGMGKGTQPITTENTHTFNDTNFTRTYTNYPATLANPFIMGLGWLLLAFGIFLSFSFVFAMFRR